METGRTGLQPRAVRRDQNDLVVLAVVGGPGEEPGAVGEHGAGQAELASRTRLGDRYRILPGVAVPGRGADGERAVVVPFEPGEAREDAVLDQQHGAPALQPLLAGRRRKRPGRRCVSGEQEEVASAGFVRGAAHGHPLPAELGERGELGPRRDVEAQRASPGHLQDGFLRTEDQPSRLEGFGLGMDRPGGEKDQEEAHETLRASIAHVGYPTLPVNRSVLFLAATLVLACRGEEKPPAPAHQGPIVLITIDALRADAVGALGGPPKLTPNLDKLASEASWKGRAVSPSSWTVPAMASLFTGLQPWSVQSWSSDRAVLREDLITLPEALKAKGYRTSAFRSNHWLERTYGYAQGFDEFRYLAQGKRAENRLEKLGPGREFVWVHILPPHAPYVRRQHLMDRLPEAPPDLPQKVRPVDLEPYYDPAVPLPPEQEKVFRAMYALNVAYADEMLGRMVASLRKSGQWDRTLLVVTADHGEEFGEFEQIAHGGNLGRQLVEVPLMIKLPVGFKLKVKPGERAATARVRATLLEAAGWEPEEGTAPSLFHKEDGGVLSELYAGNGVNRFSWVEGDRQLLWESRFAKPEPEYYRAPLRGDRGKAGAPAGRALQDRLRTAGRGLRPHHAAERPGGRTAAAHPLALDRQGHRAGERSRGDREDGPSPPERLARRERQGEGPGQEHGPEAAAHPRAGGGDAGARVSRSPHPRPLSRPHTRTPGRGGRDSANCLPMRGSALGRHECRPYKQDGKVRACL